MGTEVTLGAAGRSGRAYLSEPALTGPGVVVVHDTYGLLPHVRQRCEWLAEAGFVALAVDLYDGRVAGTAAEAERLTGGLDLPRARGLVAIAATQLLARPKVRPQRVGAVGFGLGGRLALQAATTGALDAIVAFYAILEPAERSLVPCPTLLHLTGGPTEQDAGDRERSCASCGLRHRGDGADLVRRAARVRERRPAGLPGQARGRRLGGDGRVPGRPPARLTRPGGSGGPAVASGYVRRGPGARPAVPLVGAVPAAIERGGGGGIGCGQWCGDRRAARTDAVRPRGRGGDLPPAGGPVLRRASATTRVLRPLYPEQDLGPAEERLRMFLVQYWGGPRTYSERRGHPRLRMRHAPFAIGTAERDAWLRHMREAVDSLELPAEQEQPLWQLPGDGRATACRTSGTPPGPGSPPAGRRRRAPADRARRHHRRGDLCTARPTAARPRPRPDGSGSRGGGRRSSTRCTCAASPTPTATASATWPASGRGSATCTCSASTRCG